ncbi:MAG: hypothetical protein ABIJ18_00925 [archaeon]
MANKSPERNIVHIRINIPVSKRRELLNSTIECVELIRKAKELQHLRTEKEKALEDFRKELRGIERLIKTIRFEELPLDLNELKHVKGINDKNVFKTKKNTKKTAKKVKKPQVMVKVPPRDPIDRQIDDLKRKMSSL